MAENTHLNLELKNYLLGNITSEEERTKIETRLMTDDDYFEQFSTEESELVQDYADGLLSESDRENFERHYLKTEERREKVKFAQALRKVIDEEENASEAEINEKEGGFVSFFKNMFSPLPVTLLAVGVLILAGGITWSFIKNSSPPGGDKTVLAALNKAHEKERPFESRISGFDYAPANNLRGNSKDKVNSIELNLAENVALTNASKNPSAENFYALGQVYLAEKKFDEAIKEFQKAQKLAPENAEVSSDLGAALLEESKLQPPDAGGKKLELTTQALEAVEKALQLNPKQTSAQFNKALCLQALTSTEKARKAWQEYLELDPGSKWADEARRNLESLDSSKPQSKTKDEILREFLTSYRSRDDDKAWQISNNTREIVKGKLIPQQLAFLFLTAEGEEKKEYLQAFKYAAELEKQKRGDPFFSDIAQVYAGSSAGQQSVLKKAHESLQAGFNLYLEDKYQASYESFSNAEALFEQSGSEREAKYSRYWAAFCRYNMSDLAQHKKVLEELAAYCEKNNYKWFLAEIYVWLGVNAEEATEYSKAIEYHKKAVRLSEEISDIYNLEKTLTILADEYAKVKQYQSALKSLQKSLSLADEFPETSLRQKWRNFNTGAIVFYNLKYYSASIAFETEAQAISEETDDKTFIREANLNLGIIHGRQGKYREAIEYVNKSREAAESLTEEETREKYLAAVYTQLGNFKRLSGDCAGAVEEYGKAVQFSAATYKPEEYTARKNRLLCYAAQNDDAVLQPEITQVLDLFEQNRRKITEEASRNTFFDNEQDVYDLAIKYEFGKGDYRRAFNYSETSRSRSLLDLLKNGAQISGGESEIKLPEIAEPLPLDAIRQTMPDESQIVQYSVLDDKVLIWLISKNDFAVFSSPVSANALNEKISAYLDFVLDGTKESSGDEERNLSKELYQILISPVIGKLDAKKEIAFVPDKFLFRLPFQALLSPETDKFLVEDFTGFYSPSANVFAISSAKAKKVSVDSKESLLAVGNPAFDKKSFPDLPDLPGAEKEARAITAFYPGAEPLIGKNAGKGEIKLRLPKADIVHFAGHYIVNDTSPMRSFLLAAGEGDQAVLSNFELMKEISTTSPRAKLIILSACQTGVERYYNGEGMIGASRVFLGMGIPLVIASQWQVDSEATESLMTKFHYYRKKENLTSAAALRQAQRDLLAGQKEDFKKPFYWAAFAPIGGFTQF
jgi:CHAT domain-containing protein